ncbi:MAG: metal-dependent hydrolase [Candidatus Heimdallarchaeota archaeon]|nr:metal-dependent hydrolase [Candidatus Heimdallarchaeota archaeon]MCK4877746.1 metal-dependent hydrolase [Candidatus Heimdallarchaeota archaeon]
MSSRLTHIVGGLVFSLPIVGLVYFFFTEEFSYFRLALIIGISFLCVFMGAIFPDIIERPTNPDHRGLFHSWLMLSLVFISAFIICFVVIPRYEENLFPYPVFGFLLGYLSHLLLDSTTKSSLR